MSLELVSQSITKQPYPHDGPVFNLTWDTNNNGYAYACADYNSDDPYYVYIMRVNADASQGTVRTNSLYKFHLISKGLTKLFDVAGSYNTSARFTIPRNFFINYTYNYFVFCDNYSYIYVADLTTGAILTNFNTFDSTSFEVVWNNNKKDFSVFLSTGGGGSGYYTVVFDNTLRTATFSAKISYPGAIGGMQRMFFHKNAPTSISLTGTQVFCTVHQGSYGSSTVNSNIGLNIYDTSTGTFIQNTNYSNIYVLASGYDNAGAFSLGTASMTAVYDNSILAFLGGPYKANPTNGIMYTPIILNGLAAPTVTNLNGTTFQSGAGYMLSGGFTQRYDRRQFAWWDSNGDVWFCRGNPVINGLTKLFTTPFITDDGSKGFNYQTFSFRGLILTKYGIVVAGQFASVTNAAPVGFYPLVDV